MLDELRKLSRQFLKLKNSPYRRYFIETNPFKHRLSILLGQRGVGKTTTLVQYLLDTVEQDLYSDDILYVQADHFLVGDSSMYDIAETFQAYGGRTIAFDEIHKYVNWSQELKSIYDTFPDLRVVASGSSALQLHQGSHDLARRAIKYSMRGLSFREFLELSLEIDLSVYSFEDVVENHERLAAKLVAELDKIDHKVLPLFHRYLKSGYYPYFLELPNEDLYLITLEQNLHSTIEVDLVAIYPYLNRSSINKLKELLIFIAKAVPFSPNWSMIKELLSFGDVRTLRNYFKFLEDASLIRSLSKSQRKLDHLKRPEKVYLDNPNLMYALTLDKRNSGTEREIFFLDMVSLKHDITLPSHGDFLVDGTYLFEVGGAKKNFKQIANEANGLLACDNIEIGVGNKIPLWLLGFLY